MSQNTLRCHHVMSSCYVSLSHSVRFCLVPVDDIKRQMTLYYFSVWSNTEINIRPTRLTNYRFIKNNQMSFTRSWWFILSQIWEGRERWSRIVLGVLKWWIYAYVWTPYFLWYLSNICSNVTHTDYQLTYTGVVVKIVECSTGSFKIMSRDFLMLYHFGILMYEFVLYWSQSTCVDKHCLGFWEVFWTTVGSIDIRYKIPQDPMSVVVAFGYTPGFTRRR